MAQLQTLVRGLALAAVMALPGAPQAVAQESLAGDVLHRMTLLRAAPGRLLELVAAVKSRVPSEALVVRHSQGDHWDLMVLVPIGSYAAHFAAPASTKPIAEPGLIAWQEDEFCRGPDLSKIDNFRAAGLLHVEMFHALAGRVSQLVEERAMENRYLTAVGRPPAAIFRRELGASWDVFTVAPYRDWRHYAERDGIAPERATAAAKAAGFASDEAIGPYLRSLIDTHHDTLGTVVK